MAGVIQAWRLAGLMSGLMQTGVRAERTDWLYVMNRSFSLLKKEPGSS